MEPQHNPQSSLSAAEWALRSSGLAVWDWDIATGRIIYDPTWLSLLGMPMQESTLAGREAYVHPDDLPLVREAIWRHLAGETTLYTTEHRLRHADGRWIWVEDRGTIIERAANSRPRRMVGTAKDITAQRKIAAELATKQQQFEKTVSQLPGVVYKFRLTMDGLFEFLYVSEQIEALYGVSVEAVYQDAASLIECTLAEDLDGFLESIYASASTMNPWRREYRIRHQDGTIRWLRAQSTPQQEPDGSILWHGIMNDITAERGLLHSVQQSETRYRVISELSSDYAYALRVEPDGSLVREWMTDAFQRVTGFTPQESEARGGWARLIHPADLPGAAAYLKDILAHEDRGEYEYRIIRRDGEIRTLASRFQIERDPETGAVMRIYGAASDITPQKQAEAAALEEQAFVQAIVDTLPSHLYILDVVEGRLVFSNQAIVELLGYTPDEAIQWDEQHLADLIHPDDFDRLNGTILRLEGTLDNPIFEVEYRVRHRDGVYRWVEDHMRVFQRTQSGAVSAVLGIMIDVTQRRENEAELARYRAHLEALVRERTEKLVEANAHLKRLSTAKDRFVSNVSHELRTPITSLKLYHQLLIQSPERFDDYMATITREVKRLERLIEDLLTLSRLEQDREPFRLKPIDVTEVLTDYIKDRGTLAKQAGLNLTSDMPHPEQLAVVLADPVLIEMVLSVLVTNAINYTPEGGSVTISQVHRVEDGRSWYGFAVRDTGVGIAEHEQPLIFERFYRGKTQLDAAVPGTGLGLSIAKEIVERHEGHIDLVSELGKGTTFTVWLPASDEDAVSRTG